MHVCGYVLLIISGNEKVTELKHLEYAHMMVWDTFLVCCGFKYKSILL